MLPSIACAVMLLLAPAGARVILPAAFTGIDGGGRAPGVLALKSPAFVHEAEGDFRWLIRSAPASEFSAAPHPNGSPSRIILMRHSDKPDDPDDPDLSSADVVRAGHLATYIPQTFGKPDYIIATAHSKHSDRPLETVEPLARAVGVPVQHDVRDKEFEDLIDEIFSDEAYRGKALVICWHHGTLPGSPPWRAGGQLSGSVAR